MQIRTFAVTLLLPFLVTSCETMDPPVSATSAAPTAAQFSRAVSMVVQADHYYDASAPREAILGMWNTSTSYQASSGNQMLYNLSWLFNSNGTGLYRASLRTGGESRLEDDPQTRPFTWKHDGRGWWTVSIPMASVPGHITPSRFRMSPTRGGGDSRSLFQMENGYHLEASRVKR